MTIDKKILTELWDYFYKEKLKHENNFFKIRNKNYYSKRNKFDHFLNEIEKALAGQIKKKKRKDSITKIKLVTPQG